MKEIKKLTIDEGTESIIEEIKRLCNEKIGEDKRWVVRLQYDSRYDKKYFCLTHIEATGGYREHNIKYNTETRPYVIYEIYNKDDELLSSERIAKLN